MKNLIYGLLMVAFMSFGFVACKTGPKDADVKANVESTVGNGVTATVNNGAVTLTGEVADDAAKAAAETAAQGVEGVKSVTNNITVTPVEISADPALANNVAAEVAKYPGVNATVTDGVVTLRGTISKADLPNLMSALMAMNPKNVENQLTVQ